jgi:hypothetical protein
LDAVDPLERLDPPAPLFDGERVALLAVPERLLGVVERVREEP